MEFEKILVSLAEFKKFKRLSIVKLKNQKL